LLLLFTSGASFIISAIESGNAWLNDAQILAQGVTILVLVNIPSYSTFSVLLLI
jgi:hypothetical protein